MTNKACLDTGIITQSYSKEPPKSILLFMDSIKAGKIEAYVLSPIIVEVFYHICKLKGKANAETMIATFLKTYPIKIVNLNQSLIFKAGILKCQHRAELSYNDCYAIAFSLNKKITFHTTEKSLSKILPTLKLKTYRF
jgi:predicted nucleic acid-binding protein